MAHQNLQFQVDPTQTKIWQPVLGGQAHGTFFMIYMRFDDAESHRQDEKGNFLYKCDFKLQNYRGAITIGLAEIVSSTRLVQIEDLEAKEVTRIRVKIIPFHKNDEVHNSVLVFQKKIEKDMLAVIQLELLNPPIELFDSSDLENSKYINPYTHFRDGDEFDEVTRRKVGETKWPEINNSAGTGLGFCLPDIFIFSY